MTIQDAPVKASGTTLGYKLTSGATSFTSVGQLKNFDAGGTDIAKIDTTILASLAKASIPSIPDNGDLTFTLLLVFGDATVAQMQTWSQVPATVPWQIQLPDGSSPTTGTTIAFNAYLSNFTMKGFEVDGTPTADITITITGGVTVVLGT